MALSKKLLAGALAAVVAVALCLGATLSASTQSAYAEDYPTSQAVTVKVAGTDISATYTKEQLSNYGLLNSADTLGYLYKKPNGEWYTVALKDTIALDTLFAAAGASSYWTAGAHLEITCTDGTYTKYYPTYEDATQCTSFYPNMGATTVNISNPVSAPAVLGFSYSQTQIGEGQTAADVLGGSDWVASTRLGLGLNDTTVYSTGDANMGKRLMQDITVITIVPASANA